MLYHLLYPLHASTKPVSHWRFADVFTEDFAEIIVVGKTASISDFFDRCFATQQQLAGELKADMLEVLAWADAYLLGKNSTKIEGTVARYL